MRTYSRRGPLARTSSLPSAQATNHVWRDALERERERATHSTPTTKIAARSSRSPSLRRVPGVSSLPETFVSDDDNDDNDEEEEEKEEEGKERECHTSKHSRTRTQRRLPPPPPRSSTRAVRSTLLRSVSPGRARVFTTLSSAAKNSRVTKEKSSGRRKSVSARESEEREAVLVSSISTSQLSDDNDTVNEKKKKKKKKKKKSEGPRDVAKKTADGEEIEEDEDEEDQDFDHEAFARLDRNVETTERLSRSRSASRERSVSTERQRMGSVPIVRRTKSLSGPDPQSRKRRRVVGSGTLSSSSSSSSRAPSSAPSAMSSVGGGGARAPKRMRGLPSVPVLSGENQRLLDSFEYLLDGLALTQPLELRRTNMYEMACLVRKEGMARLLRSQTDLFSRLFDTLGETALMCAGDEVMSLATATTYLFVFSEPLNCEFVTPACVRSFVHFLAHDGVSSRSFPSSSTPTTTKKNGRHGGGVRGGGSLLSRLADSRRERASKSKTNGPIAKVRALLAKHVWDEEQSRDASAQSVALATLALVATAKPHLGEFLRENGFLGDIVTRMLALVDDATSRGSLASDHRRIESCLRVYETVTLENRDMQNYLLDLPCALVARLLRLISSCYEHVRRDRSALASLADVWRAALSVLLNLSNENLRGAELAGACTEDLKHVLEALRLRELDKVSLEREFDLRLLSLGLLINLCEESARNRESLAHMKVRSPTSTKPMNALAYVCELFVETNANATDDMAQNVQCAYTALLLACLVRDHNDNRREVEACLPYDEGLVTVGQVIKEFVAFQHDSGLLSRHTFDTYRTLLKDLVGDDEEQEADNVLASE